MRSYAKSQQLYERALKVTPGASQTGSKAPGRAGPLDKYPLFLHSGYGPNVVDVDGNAYLDFIASLAAVGLGHGDGHVLRAVYETLNSGALMSLPTKLEADASEALCRITGWAEQVRWVKTGSEATEAAVRIARKATGRERILTVTSGYHAWHSWFQAVKPQHPGVPNALTELIDGMDYGGNVAEMFAPWLPWDGYAAVILEPAPITGGGSAEWLRQMVEIAHEHGTLVIFDEVVWGFRLAKAGGTEHFGVTPDLATYGKAMGNGVPVGAVVGKADLMQHADVISGTFGGDGLGLAAACAVMDIYERESIIANMWERGTQFQKAVNAFGHNGVLTLSCSGYPVHPVIDIYVVDTPKNVVMTFFLQRLAERGVLWHPAGGNIIAAHTAQTIDDATNAIYSAAIDTADAAHKAPLAEQIVAPYQAAFARAR